MGGPTGRTAGWGREADGKESREPVGLVSNTSSPFSKPLTLPPSVHLHVETVVFLMTVGLGDERVGLGAKLPVFETSCAPSYAV